LTYSSWSIAMGQGEDAYELWRRVPVSRICSAPWLRVVRTFSILMLDNLKEDHGNGKTKLESASFKRMQLTWASLAISKVRTEMGFLASAFLQAERRGSSVSFRANGLNKDRAMNFLWALLKDDLVQRPALLCMKACPGPPGRLKQLVISHVRYLDRRVD
jgi:hypothetical protein